MKLHFIEADKEEETIAQAKKSEKWKKDEEAERRLGAGKE